MLSYRIIIVGLSLSSVEKNLLLRYFVELDRSMSDGLTFNYQQCQEPANRFFVNNLRNVDLRENKPQKYAQVWGTI